MYIQKVKIRNVRGFKEVDLDFTRPDGSFAGWTVLAGRNGSGKSSLLRLLPITILGSTYSAVLLHGSSGEWLRAEAPEGASSVILELSPTERSGPENLSTTSWGVKWHRRGGSEVASDTEPQTTERILQRQHYFLAGYGPYRRLTGHTAEAQNRMSGTNPVARVITLFDEGASLIESVTWLREIQFRFLEEQEPGVRELKDAILALLNDGLLPDGIVIEQITSAGLWVRQNRVRLPLSELSDGYRTTAALVMDLVRHLHGYYKDLRIEKAKDEEGHYLRVLHEGVVLIDEVDLHLHISWQKRIGFWLKRHFPNIQFIVTTHSPFVCQAADPKGLIRLPAPGEDRPAEHVPEELYKTVVNGSLDEAVLTDLFGLETPYSDQTEKLRERVAKLEARLQSGEATPTEEEEFDQLSSQLPQTLPSAVEQALRKLAADV